MKKRCISVSVGDGEIFQTNHGSGSRSGHRWRTDAGGPFDLVIAARMPVFDPVVAFGVNGVEYFAHPWEVGVRKAKEMLFTGEAITAEEPSRLVWSTMWYRVMS